MLPALERTGIRFRELFPGGGGLVEDVDAIRPLTIAVSAAYLALSVRFWFYVPAITIGIGTACFAVASVLSL